MVTHGGSDSSICLDSTENEISDTDKGKYDSTLEFERGAQSSTWCGGQHPGVSTVVFNEP